MATKSATRDSRPIPTDETISPPFWFLAFHEATRKGDVVAAAQAQGKLRELNYRVSTIKNRGGA